MNIFFSIVYWLMCPVTCHCHDNATVLTYGLSSSFLPLVFCCRAGSAYPSTVSPHRPFCSCLLECYVVTVHGVRLLPLVLLPSILPSKILCRKLSCLSMWPIDLCFCCHISFSRHCSSFTLFNTSSLVILSLQQLIFSISLQIDISKASTFFLSTSLKVHVSAAYVAKDQTRHLTILFFSSRFIFPVNNFLLVWVKWAFCNENLTAEINEDHCKYLTAYMQLQSYQFTARRLINCTFSHNKINTDKK